MRPKFAHIAALAALLMLLPAAGFAGDIYHIDPDTGDNSNTGLSHTQALETWAGFIAKSPGTGDDVYIKCGTTLTPSSYLNITWDGTSGDPAVIGAYYMDGATEVYGENDDGKPIIDGQSYTVPSFGTYLGLLNVSGDKDYITIENIEIKESGDKGINVRGGYETNNSPSYINIENCYINGSMRHGIMFERSPYAYSNITGVEVKGASRMFYEGSSRWPNAIKIDGCPYSYITVSGCYVHDGWGEGIGAGRISTSSSAANSGYVTIEDNVIFNQRRVNIYIDSGVNNIVRRNLCIGASSSYIVSILGTRGVTSGDDRYWNQYGIWVNSETTYGHTVAPNNNEIYNNIVVGHYSGIGFSCQVDAAVVSGNKFYNNTVIGCRYNWIITSNLEAKTLTGIEYKNNVSLCPSDCISSDVQYNYSWIATKSGIATDHNSWHSTSATSNWAGTGDVQTDANWSKLSGWQSLTSISGVSVADFMPLSNSNVVDRADDIGDDYKDGISVYDTSYNLPISVTTADRDVVGWDMGAVPYQGEAPPVTQYRYLGWSTSSGVPSTFPYGENSAVEDRTLLHKWTATEAGTLKGLRFAVKGSWSTDYAYGIVLKDNGATLDCIGAVTLPNSLTTNSWTTEYDLVETSTDSLEFDADDVLYFGVAFDPTASMSALVGVSYNREEGVDYYYIFTEAGYNVGASTPTSYTEASMSAYTPRQLGVVLSYDVNVGTDETDPTITITSPTSDATYTVTGNNRINLGGTCSDNATVAYMTWASTAGDSGDCSGDLPWETWEVQNIPIPTTGAVITITGEDDSENEGTDAITVSFSPPANSNTVGWDDADNPPDDSITVSGEIDADRTYLNPPWTATEGGDIAGVYFYAGDTWDATESWVVAYKVDGLNYTLLAYAPISAIAKSAYNYVPFTNPVSGQSLRFATNDQILAGFAVDVATAFKYGRETSGGSGLLRSAETISGAPTDLVIATDIVTLSGYDGGITLVYTDLPGDVTAPSVAITTPAANVSTPVSTYTISGTASDETELDFVYWSCEESNNNGILSVSEGAWSDTILLTFGVNTITVTAYDTTGNSATDEVTITQVNPTSTLSGSGTFQ